MNPIQVVGKVIVGSLWAGAVTLEWAAAVVDAAFGTEIFAKHPQAMPAFDDIVAEPITAESEWGTQW